MDALWHEGLTRRLRSLLKTAPFHSLRAHETRRSATRDHDDTLALAMRALEVMVDAVGLRAGASRDELRAALLPLLKLNDTFHGVPPDESRHRDVVEAVLGMLLNDADRRQAYRAEYLEFPDGAPVRRAVSFRLAAEVEAPDGEIVVRAESDGVNLFLRSLDVDLEDAHAAAEAVIRSQLERGRWDLAETSAREAQIRSKQYEDKVLGILARTRRDIAQVDWASEMPRLMGEARRHLDGRMTIEREMLSQVRTHLDDASEPAAVRALVRVKDALEECLRRHISLHGRLMDAFNVFRSEQERQRFIPLSTLPVPPLEEGLFRPVLALPLDAARNVAIAFARDVHPATVRPVLDVGNLWDLLLRPVRAAPSRGRVIDETEPMPLEPERPPFPPEVCFDVDALLRTVQARTPLSSIIRQAPSPVHGDFLVLRALQHFAPDDSPPLPLRAERNGAVLQHGLFTGDDLDLFPDDSSP